MMSWNAHWRKTILIFALLNISLGFTGHERFVELEGFINGRTSAAFRKSDTNVRAVLASGTRGKILSSKKLPSGNYAIKVKTVNGAYKGQTFWVYYNVANPSLKTYDQAPANWGTPKVRGPVAEATRDVPALGQKISAEAIAKKTDRLNSAVRRTTGPELPCVGCAGTDNIPVPKPPLIRGDRVRSEHQPVGRQAPARDEAAAPIASSRRGMEQACYQIIGPDGKYGSWGRAISGIMNEERYKTMFTKSAALGKFCPRFDSLSSPQKIKAWTWFWQSLADEESSCRKDVVHGTTFVNPRTGAVEVLNVRPGYGLWALEKDRNIREGRGPACRDISSVDGQARCAIDIMFKTQLRRGATASESSLKYWGPTYNHRNDRQIMPHMRRFSACF